MNIQRYGPVWDGRGLEPKSHGKWVKYEDIAAEIEHLRDDRDHWKSLAEHWQAYAQDSGIRPLAEGEPCTEGGE